MTATARLKGLGDDPGLLFIRPASATASCMDFQSPQPPVLHHIFDHIFQSWSGIWPSSGDVGQGGGETPLTFYLYLILDVFSRKIVGWEVHEREGSDLAARLVEQTV